MQQGVNFQNVLENVLKRKNSNSVPGICRVIESTKHIDFLNLGGGLPARTPACTYSGGYPFGTGGQPSISHGINLNPPE
jgi:hypothetical protein